LLLFLQNLGVLLRFLLFSGGDYLTPPEFWQSQHLWIRIVLTRAIAQTSFDFIHEWLMPGQKIAYFCNSRPDAVFIKRPKATE